MNELVNDKFIYGNNYNIIGLTNELNVFYVLNFFNNHEKNVLLLTNTLYEANSYYKLFSTYIDNVYLFPMDDFLTSVALAVSPDLKIKRLETLESISNGKCLVITNLMGYLKFLPNKDNSSNLSFTISHDSNIKRDDIISLLDKYGYNKESLVTSTGEYAVRGYIIDLFNMLDEHPIRIEFFGDDIDSIRYFDENTQLSINDIDSFVLKPFKEVESKDNSSLYDYLNNPSVFIVDKDQIDIAYDKLQREVFEYNESISDNKKYMFDFDDIKINYVEYISKFDNDKGDKKISYNSQEIDNFNSNFDLFEKFVKEKLKFNYTIFIYLSKESQLSIIKSYIDDYHLVNNNGYCLNKVNIIFAKLNRGFVIDNYIFISENDFEKKSNVVSYKNTYRMGRKLKDYSQLNNGDYVVHASHGIGRYHGLITLTKNGIKKDYLRVDYNGNDKIYIPVEKISILYKYSDKEGSIPKIDSLGSTSWAKKKRELKKRIKDISQELLNLYAIRQNTKSDVYQSYEEELIFANNFEYEETVDQLKAIDDINKDLISAIPMDRLLCGDVGFGKTEVAFRAMFKTVLNNKQVLYLCPTTILSRQQYESAKVRFKDYPIEMALLNRYTSTMERNRIIDGLKNGKIDIVFGTHRLLSNDVEFFKLGLLVIDEEQRFGVTQKEKIKKLKSDINVLTLSATPIPRTLKMSLSGLRDLSIIDTPPVNRYPVQTYVLKENDLIVKDAIYKEMSRNGQVFILYNRINGLEDIRVKIKKLVPEARIIMAHGQMSKNELESVMNDFINYNADILICTTIIETGIDISNVNTLIIYDADKFGLSQLYQLRGRVGRSNRIAYAYLLFDANKMLNDIAIKRLQAIKDFTELGSGYKIAMRDLAIRGAGDLLGSEQAGFVDTVGIDLYMQMVDEQVRILKGEMVEDESVEANKALVEVDTHIDDEYVSDEDIKIEIHKLINDIDSYEKLLSVKSELEDRFGKIKKELEIYMYEEWFEKQAKLLNICDVRQTERDIEFILPSTVLDKLSGEQVFMMANQVSSYFKFRYYNNELHIYLNFLHLDKHFLYYIVILCNRIIDKLNT